ncbi:hypothetical protein BBJ28_00006091 [Nothophytophthora sp. Chile5]|nr:hypothetical protein BBJ28_00006091 [Nothophytophthora sp. Chile5]
MLPGHLRCWYVLSLACLLSSDAHRLDAALRDAEEGYNVCAVCGFENFKRFQFCTVCGEEITVDSDSEEQQGDSSSDRSSANRKKKLAARLSLLPLFKRESRVQLVTSVPPTPSPRASRRRLRAQRRKEWTRKLDIQGRPFWFRDGRHGVDLQFSGFVVEFQAALEWTDATAPVANLKQLEDLATVSADPVLEDRLPTASSVEAAPSNGSLLPPISPSDSQIDITAGPDTPRPVQEEAHVVDDNEAPADQPSPQPTDSSVVDLIASLEKETAAMHPVFVAASDIDATKLPVAVRSSQATFEATSGSSRSGAATATMSTPLKETLAFADKDFPTKYAHFVTATAALLVPSEREHLRLNVERANLFDDSMESLAIIPIQNVHSVLRINFLDESGVDAGGLQREWFVMLNEMLVEPERGLFTCSNKTEQTFYLSPAARQDLLPRQLLYLFATGRLVGRALLEGSMMGFHLAPPLLKLMLGLPLSFADLEDLDPEVYANLLWLLKNEDVDALGLDFTVTVKDGDVYRDVALVPGGSEMIVTDANKHEYVERKWQYLLVESVAPQLQAFLQGLYEIIPRELLLLFDPEEFDFVLCGSDEIDVDDWQRSTKYTEELHSHRALTWFWELVREMPNEYRRRLLLFATGTSRVPLAGFSALTSYDGRLCPFTLKGISLVGDGFIHSHACFNRLDLPLHVVREELKAVLYATLETELYGFTTD